MKFPKNELMVCNNNTHLVNIPQNGGEMKENYIVPSSLCLTGRANKHWILQAIFCIVS
jgi:hypothetical protein